MSLFKKTRLDRPVANENKQSEVAKELEDSYPRIEEETPKRVSNNTASFPKEPEPTTKTRANKTINPYMLAQTKAAKTTVKLTPITKDGEQSLAELQIESGAMVINRANLDPENPTISGKSHALVEVKDGQIFISNQTSAETTFIQVRQPTRLQNGDVVLLGNRLVRIDIENTNVAPTGLED